MTKLAIIGTGYMACIIAKRAKELGIETHCFSHDIHSLAQDVCDYFHNINILDVELLANKCIELNINGVVATTELTIYPTSFVANKLGLNGNPIKVAREITDKSLVRLKTCDIDGLSKLKYFIYKKNDNLPLNISYPVIVKPLAAGGKRGISVVDSYDKLNIAVSEAMKVSKIEGVLIEEFLSGGQEYSVESLSYHGRHYIIQVTEKDSSGPPHCVELGHHQPANLSSAARKNVEKVVIDILTAVGVLNGPCHTEIKIINNNIYLIEVNGRPGGDHIAYPLTELSTGYPYITGIIMTALNKLNEKELINFKNYYSGVCFISTQSKNLLEIFENCDDKEWLYKKNKVSDVLKPIIYNDGMNTNYFIYFSKDKKPNFKN